METHQSLEMAHRNCWAAMAERSPLQLSSWISSPVKLATLSLYQTAQYGNLQVM